MTKNGSKTPIADPAAAARAEVDRLNAAELQFAMLYRSKAAELAGVRAHRGDQVLDAANPEGAAREAGQRASVMREELESLGDASRRARERRLQAIPAVFSAQADEAERGAAQLEAEAEDLEAESIRLRKVLEEHDDCAYLPSSETTERMMRAYQGAELTTVQIRVPRFRRLRTSALDKRSEAAQTRLKSPHQAGGVDADTVEDLFAAVHSDAMRIGPPVDAIVSWAEQATEKERRRRERIASTEVGFAAADAPMSLHLEWRNGVIDQAQSRIVTAMAAAVSSDFDSDAGFEEQGAAQPAQVEAV